MIVVYNKSINAPLKSITTLKNLVFETKTKRCLKVCAHFYQATEK